MKRLLPVLTLLALLAGCRTEQQQTDTSSTTATSPSATQCYAYVSATDTIRLTMTRTGDNVTGTLLYNLAGKDQNTGTLSGRMRGDTLLADYRFRSEGTESVREVAFVVQEGRLVEGYGPVVEQPGKMAFRNSSALTFSATMPLTPADCP